MTRSNSLRYYVLLVFIFLLPLGSCGPKYKTAKAHKQTEKRLEQRRKEGDRALLEGRKRHQTVQSKETRKRMKQTRKQSQGLNKSRKVPFYQRWYNAIRKR
jgi:hypothetical protein